LDEWCEDVKSLQVKYTKKEKKNEKWKKLKGKKEKVSSA